MSRELPPRPGYSGPRRQGIAFVSSFRGKKERAFESVSCPNCGEIATLGDPYVSISGESVSHRRVGKCLRESKRGDRCPAFTLPADAPTSVYCPPGSVGAVTPTPSVKKRIYSLNRAGYTFETMGRVSGLSRTTIGHYLKRGLVDHSPVMKMLEQLEQEVLNRKEAEDGSVRRAYKR